MMKQAAGIVEPEKTRTNNLPTSLKFSPVPEAADDTVRASIALDLLHAVPLTGLIRKIEAFRDHAIASSSCRRKPMMSVLKLQTGRGKPKKICAGKVTRSEVFKQRPPPCQRFALK